MKKQARYLASILTFSFLLCPAGAVSLDAGRASQNPFLRDVFKRQALMSADLANFYPGVTVDPVALEFQVDRLIYSYLQDIAKKTLRLKEEFLRVKQVREQLTRDAVPMPQRRSLLILKKERLGELSDRAKDLRKSLGYLFRGVRSEEDVVVTFDRGSANQAFEQEMQYLGEQIALAENKIVRYLFTASQVVSVSSLRGDTVLLNLYRVQKISQDLEDRI